MHAARGNDARNDDREAWLVAKGQLQGIAYESGIGNSCTSDINASPHGWQGWLEDEGIAWREAPGIIGRSFGETDAASRQSQAMSYDRPSIIRFTPDRQAKTWRSGVKSGRPVGYPGDTLQPRQARA